MYVSLEQRQKFTGLLKSIRLTLKLVKPQLDDNAKQEVNELIADINSQLEELKTV